MKSSRTIIAAALLCGAIAMPATIAPAQQTSLKEQLTGAWMPVSVKYKFRDGKTEDAMGPNPRGLMIFDASGHIAFINMRSTLPKFPSNDRLKATADEYKAIGQGSYAYFGTYTVNDQDKSFTLHIDGSTFPNFDGTNQKRSVTLAGDELRYTSPVATIGQGALVESVWKRATAATVGSASGRR